MSDTSLTEPPADPPAPPDAPVTDAPRLADTPAPPEPPSPAAVPSVEPVAPPTVDEAPRALTPEQLAELIGLIRGADSVELKLTVPDEDRYSAITALKMDPLLAQMRQVVFFDTPDLQLNRSGVVVRARRIQGREADSVVKLRPVVPEDIPPDLRASPWFGVEVDAMPGGFVCSASMKAAHDDVKVKAVIDGERSIKKIFSKEQRKFYEDHAPEGLDLDSLSRLGPINVIKLKFTPVDFPRKLVAELWFYPDGSRLLELSTKCAPGDAFTVSAEARAYLGTKGIDLMAEQQTKTRTALEYFSSQLAGQTS
jgi:hypothetical protein